MLIFYTGAVLVMFLLVGSIIVLAVAIGEAGQAWARRHERQCPDCDYRPPRHTRAADMLIHRVLEHERE